MPGPSQCAYRPCLLRTPLELRDPEDFMTVTGLIQHNENSLSNNLDKINILVEEYTGSGNSRMWLLTDSSEQLWNIVLPIIAQYLLSWS